MITAGLCFLKNRLITRYLHFVDGFSQVCQGLMRINALSNAGSSVPEYHFHRRLISACPVEHSSQCVPAFVRRVMHPKHFHGMVKEPAKCIVLFARADFSLCFSFGKDRQDFIMDGDFTHSCQSLTLFYIDIPLPEINISGHKCKVLTDTHAGIDKDEHIFNAFYGVS